MLSWFSLDVVQIAFCQTCMIKILSELFCRREGCLLSPESERRSDIVRSTGLYGPCVEIKKAFYIERFNRRPFIASV